MRLASKREKNTRSERMIFLPCRNIVKSIAPVMALMGANGKSQSTIRGL